MIRLKALAPGTLFGRALVLLLAPIIIVQTLSTYFFYDRHWETVTRRLALALGGEIAMLMRAQMYFPPNEQAALREIVDRRLELQVTFAFDKNLTDRDFSHAPTGIEELLTRVLAERIHDPFVVRGTPDDTIEIDVQLPTGVMRVVTRDKRVTSNTTILVTAWGIGTSVLLVFVAVLFMRNQVRPIRRLADAAEAFGRGRAVKPFSPSGALEVRAATTAFFAMRARILRQIAHRTEMLAGVSHDLRAPLTRMKLELALLGDSDDVKSLRADVDELQQRIDAYLAFARNDDGELAVETDLSVLLDRLVGGARRGGRAVRLDCADGLKAVVRPNGLRRAVGSLLDLALARGEQVVVSARLVARRLEITVDDDGAPSETQPNELNLTIARDVARVHGGELSLGVSNLGGRRAALRLPV